MDMLMRTKGIKLRKEKREIMDKFYSWWYDCWFYNRVYMYSWMYTYRWKITHWWRNDNWIKTSLTVDYHDAPELMEDGLFSLVDRYVSKNQEDAFSICDYDNELIDIKEKIIQILHFYRVEKPALLKREAELLHEVYKDQKTEFTDCEDKPGYKLLNIVYYGKYSKEELDKLRKEHKEVENKIFERTQEMLKVCIDVRPYLWI
jgi:hypothetical protein